jgi:hypothetical protein
MASRTVSALLLVIGIVLGACGLALGALLASGNNGWASSLLFSVVGLVGAPLATLSWSSRRRRQYQALAGIALVLGILGSLGLMLEFTQETSGIRHAWSQVPAAVATWFALWAVWGIIALGRVVFNEQPKTRTRLSSRRGDAGH